eukprot:3859776-Pyramimonas_sp.AAC.1
MGSREHARCCGPKQRAGGIDVPRGPKPACTRKNKQLRHLVPKRGNSGHAPVAGQAPVDAVPVPVEPGAPLVPPVPAG